MNEGDKIPEIIGIDETGKEWNNKELLGSKWILYFYPKDNTPGCTAEACSLNDNLSDLNQLGLKIIGVSKDSAASHVKFKEKYGLQFPLITDPDHILQEAMGVWVEKKNYGKTYMGTERTTFIINEEGIIMHAIRGRKVKTKEHAAQIIELLNN